MKKKNKEEIKKIITKSIDTNLASLNDKSTCKDFAKWDSLANVKIMLQIEKKFKIKIRPQDTAKLNKVSEIYKLIDS